MRKALERGRSALVVGVELYRELAVSALRLIPRRRRTPAEAA